MGSRGMLGPLSLLNAGRLSLPYSSAAAHSVLLVPPSGSDIISPETLGSGHCRVPRQIFDFLGHQHLNDSPSYLGPNAPFWQLCTKKGDGGGVRSRKGRHEELSSGHVGTLPALTARLVARQSENVHLALSGPTTQEI